MSTFKKPYLEELPLSYKQEVFETKYILLNDEDIFLTEDGKRNIQDDLNLNVDTNSIYGVIDKFQNTNKTFSNIDEAVQFMKQVGKDPEVVFNGETIDISNAPKSLAELAKLGQRLREVYNDYINQKNNNQNVNSSGSFSDKVVEQVGSQFSNTQEAKTTEKVGDK